ncbi:MAG: class I SAM-dependent methyltransferase [Candidatus Margulisbacteria bacterium]|jgi:hypothetical protein|nr:class I SAM-dependent methyltransferase [Candidatus Margulisiibacteriota bacterium]
MTAKLTAPRLRPAREYSAREFPNLRRMTDALTAAGYRVTIDLTPAAAQAIERTPEAFLHHELYDRANDEIIIYRRCTQPVCALETRYKLGEGEQIAGYGAAELPETVQLKSVDLERDYPDRLLPFDLFALQQEMERRLAALSGHDRSYLSADHPGSIFCSADPLATYRQFHFLTRLNSQLAGRLAQVRTALEIGSGLGLTSHLLASFLTGAVLSGVENDGIVLDCARELKTRLADEYGQNTDRVAFFQEDLFDLHEVKIEEQDLTIGWFPLFSGMREAATAALLRRLRPGALFFQMISDFPFSSNFPETENGFRRIRVAQAEMMPYKMFERVASPA